MKSVTIESDKQSAINQCDRFLQYFPYRYAFLVELKDGQFGWVTGKTMARGANLARKGLVVNRVTRG